MRILLYIEPHPVRNTLTHFNDVARRFLPLLSSDARCDVRMFANNKTFDLLSKDAVALHSKRLIHATPDEEFLFEQHMRPWQNEGISTWLELMSGTGEVTDAYLKILHRLWRTFPFEIIVHWGENGAIKCFTDERPVTRIGMELGCTRPPFLNTVVMDPFGTNGSGVIPRLSIADLRKITGNNPMSRYEALFSFSENLETRGYEEQFNPLPADITIRLNSDTRIVYLPLQLFDDANLLRFSPYKTLDEVVLDIVPKLAEKGYTVIIKPHPSSKHRKNAIIANAVARSSLHPWVNNVIWCDYPDPIPNACLISISDFVVTVNSSVGFEALYFDKPVVVLGDAVYKPLDLFPTLDAVISGKFDTAAYLDGLAVLRRFLLGGYLQHDRVSRNATEFITLAGSINEIFVNASNDPVAFASAFWATTYAATHTFARSAMFRGLSLAGTAEFGQPTIKENHSLVATVAALPKELSAEALKHITRKLWVYAGRLGIDFFNSWLEKNWMTSEGRAEIIRAGNIVDPEYYLLRNDDVREAGVNPVDHFINDGLKEGRAPREAISFSSPECMFEMLHRAASNFLTLRALTEFPLIGDESSARDTQLKLISKALENSQKRILVVAHLYYRDLVAEVLESLTVIPEPFDLIVTLPNWGGSEIIHRVCVAYPETLFYKASNRGRDVGPFVDLLPIILKNNYDAVLKVQTKKGYFQNGKLRLELGEIWRQEAFAALLGSTDRVATILDAFRTDLGLNMIGPTPYFQALTNYPYQDDGDLAELLLDQPQDEGFFAGNMFWVRPACLAALLPLSILHFAPEDGASDGALAHFIERIFGQSADSGETQIAGAPINPMEPLEPALKIAQVKLQDHLITQFEKLQNAKSKKTDGQLLW